MLKNNVDDGVFRAGLKNIYALFPNSVIDRLFTDKSLKTFDKPHQDAIVSLSKEIDAVEAKFETTNQTQHLAYTLEKENLTGALDALTNLGKKFTDLKPSFDCVLYRTETHWVVIIDTTETVTFHITN